MLTQPSLPRSNLPQRDVRVMRVRGAARYLWVCAASCLMFVGAPARAQLGDLPAALVTSAQPVDAGGEASIRTFATPLIAQLASAKPEEVGAGRRRLLEMVSPGRAPSVPFRLAYAKVLLPELEKLMESGEMPAVNALVVAGELGAGDISRLLTKGRASDLASVRFQAAAGAERAVAIVNASGDAAALDQGTVNGLLRAQGDVLKNESDVLVLDKAMSALVQGINNARFREEAFKQLDDGLLALAQKHKGKSLPNELIEAMARTGTDLRQAMLGVGNVSNLSRATQQAAGGVAATIAWITSDSVRAKQVPVGEPGAGLRGRLGQAVGAAEGLGSILAQNTNAFGMSEKLRKGTNAGDAEFLDAATNFRKLMESKLGVSGNRYN